MKESILEMLLGVSAETLNEFLHKEFRKTCRELIKNLINLPEEEQKLIYTSKQKLFPYFLGDVMPEEAYVCAVRRTAYGLFGCHNCPIACPMQSDNLNRFENLNSQIPEHEKPTKALGWAPIAILTRDDIIGEAKELGVELTQEQIEKVAQRVLDNISRDDGFWEGFWQSVKAEIKAVLEEEKNGQAES